MEEGFRVHYRKTRVMRSGVRQHLAGLVINQRLNVHRRDYDRLKATLTNCVRTVQRPKIVRAAQTSRHICRGNLLSSRWFIRIERRSFAPPSIASCGTSRGNLSEIEFHLVDIAPAPVFAGFQRAHDGVLGAVKMLGGVFVLRRVAASDVSALHTEPQVHPGVAHLQALFATLGVRSYLVDVAFMRTTGHRFPPGSEIRPAVLPRPPEPGTATRLGCFQRTASS